MDNKDAVTLEKNPQSGNVKKQDNPPAGSSASSLDCLQQCLSAPQLMRVLNSAYTGYKYEIP